MRSHCPPRHLCRMPCCRDSSVQFAARCPEMLLPSNPPDEHVGHDSLSYYMSSVTSEKTLINNHNIIRLVLKMSAINN